MRMVERRKSKRFPCEIEMCLWLQDWMTGGDTRKVPGNILDISRGGTLIEIEDENIVYTNALWDNVASQQTVCLALNLNHSGQPAIITGGIAWLCARNVLEDDPQTPNFYQAGFRFDPVDSKGISEINTFMDKCYYN